MVTALVNESIRLFGHGEMAAEKGLRITSIVMGRYFQGCPPRNARPSSDRISPIREGNFPQSRTGS